MPCFLRLACSLVLSHSNSNASPSLQYTDNQYFLQGFAGARRAIAENKCVGRVVPGRDIAPRMAHPTRFERVTSAFEVAFDA